MTDPGAGVPGAVIVGAGQAGGRAAEALRAHGFEGPITLLGAEAHPPYERPSLSKEMLLDLQAETVSWVRPAEHYAAEGIDLRLGQRAVAIDRVARTVRLADGSVVPYRVLVLATGGAPRPLRAPGADHPAVLTLRTLDDSRALRRRLRPGMTLVVVGAGFIGLEVAAAARRHGIAVTVVEAAGRPMARAVPPELGDAYAALHRRHGVDLRFDAGVDAVEDEGGSPVLVLRDGSCLRADLVVVGIGTAPDDHLAADCGLRTENGIVVDEFGATDDPLVYAVGDVARHFNPVLGQHILLESWQNAQNQAIAVARNIAGVRAPYAEVPWFWSDQYDVNLQIAGLPVPGAPTIVRGAPDAGSALFLQMAGNRLAYAAATNAPRDLRMAKDLIAFGAPVSATLLADPATKLLDLHRAAKRERQAA